MTKKSKTAVGYDHVTPQLMAKVKAVIEEADKHKYSQSRVYAAHNAVFKKNDVPQACSSCLRNRVRELRAWVKDAPEDLVGGKTATTGEAIVPAKDQDLIAADGPEEMTVEEAHKALGMVPPQYDDPGAPGFVPSAEGVVRFPMGEGYIPFDFTPSADNPNKGTVINADGSKIKPGSYNAANGTVIAVQPGGKASIKAAEEDLT